MASSDFRLQSLLEYRRGLLDRARLDLASVQRREAAGRQQLDALRAAERAVLADLDAQQRVRGALDVPRVRQAHDHLQLLGGRIAAQEAALVRLEGEIAAARVKLTKLSQDLKALEKLRERHAAALALESVRRERLETSEMAATQHRRLRTVP